MDGYSASRKQHHEEDIEMGCQEPLFLVGGKQELSVMAGKLTDFIASANTSLHIAIYDFRLKDEAIAAQVVGALKQSANKGIEVQIAYDHRNAPKFGPGDDPAPHGSDHFITKQFTGTSVDFKPISWDPNVASKSIAGQKLMHSKYVIRDGHTKNAAVLMGSANFTDDAWTHQDNNVLVFESPQLCSYYETDFNELWASGDIYNTGVNDYGTVTQDGLNLDVAFSPGEGRRIDGEIVGMILNAQDSIHIASMVITSDTILNALSQVLDAGRVKVRGILDGPEMKTSKAQMQRSARSASKVQQIDQLQKILVQKKSTPYKENGVHDFMHNKLIVVDGTVLTGSHNFSLSAQHNAENAVLVRDEDLAEKYRGYVEGLIKKYGPAGT